MQFASKISFSCLVMGLGLAACATATDDANPALGNTGGSVGTGSASGSGGVSGTGSAAGTGGVSTGGTSSGGAGTGGVAATGGAGTGGASGGTGGASGGTGGATGGTGGASGGTGGATGGTGGATGGTGGVELTGECADKPTHAQWKAGSSKAMGDLVVSNCQVLQAACSSLKANTPYLWECTQSHVDNCGQDPWGGQSWRLVGECGTDMGLGGAGSTP